MLPFRRFCICVLFAFCITLVSAQEVISSSGSSYNKTGLLIDFTLGQLIQATHASGGIIVTQGYHQSFAEIVEVLNTPDLPATINTYPNPTRDFLNIEAEEDYLITYTLYDLNGSKVSVGSFQKRIALDIHEFAKGTYQLFLTNEQSQLIGTYKIQFK